MYLIFYYDQTDGEVQMNSFRTGKELKEFVKKMDLHEEDYSIVEGSSLKSFNNKNFNLERLK